VTNKIGYQDQTRTSFPHGQIQDSLMMDQIEASFSADAFSFRKPSFTTVSRTSCSLMVTC
jgi:hypothetical protein